MVQYTAAQKRDYARKMKARKALAKKSSGKGKVRVSRQVRHSINKVHIDECSQKYLLSLLNPYEQYNACIPSSFPLASQKVHVFNRGTLALGTSGLGYITCQPCIANDALVVTLTGSTSVGTDNTSINAFTNLSNLTMLKIPYSSADIAARNIQGRIVSVGLRVRYIGRADALNGLIRSIEEPDHTTLANLTPNQIYSYDQVGTERPSSDNWTGVNYSGPTTPSDIEFSNIQYPLGAVPFMAHIIAGVAGDEYAWEIYENIEYIGKLAVAKVQNSSDPKGYAKVQETIKGISAMGPVTPKDAPAAINRFTSSMAAGNFSHGIGSRLYNHATGIELLEDGPLKDAYNMGQYALYQGAKMAIGAFHGTREEL